MLKKNLFAIAFTSTTFFLLTTVTHAYCGPRDAAGYCPPATSLCPGNLLCCSRTSDCVTGEITITDTPQPFEIGCEVGNINTALGCLPTDPVQFLKEVFPWVLGIAGTIAFLLIIFGAFQYITAAGKPDQMDQARELIVSALTGLVVVIFSAVLLKIIGFGIIGLPPTTLKSK